VTVGKLRLHISPIFFTPRRRWCWCDVMLRASGARCRHITSHRAAGRHRQTAAAARTSWPVRVGRRVGRILCRRTEDVKSRRAPVDRWMLPMISARRWIALDGYQALCTPTCIHRLPTASNSLPPYRQSPPRQNPLRSPSWIPEGTHKSCVNL